MSETEPLPDTIETIPEGLAHWAERTPDAPAVCSVSGSGLTHGQLHRAVAQAAERLCSLGVWSGDQIALSLHGGRDSCVALLAAMTAGIAVPFNPAATDFELRRDLERLQPRVLVTDAPAEAASRHVAAALGLATMTVGELAADTDAPLPVLDLPPATPERIAAILHTSGTTGLPKRVPRNHRSFLAATRAARCSSGLTPEDVALLVSGVFTNAGLSNMLFSLLTGGSCVVAPGFDPDRYADWLAAHRPTWALLNATELNLILDAAAKAGRSTVAEAGSRLRFIRAGAQPMTAGTAERAERSFSALVFEGFGMTEASNIAKSGPGPEDRRPGSCGRPMPEAAEVRILDALDADVAPGSLGAVVVRGAAVFTGYLDDPGANAAAFLPGGWFRTGDLGFLDAEGFLYLLGRQSEIINRGGENIAPAEVDRVLQSHPAVAEAAVFAVPDARFGEDLVAAVVMRVGSSASPRDLRTWMLERLSPSRTPRRIWIVDVLPRTPTGKVQRAKLAQRWSEEGDVTSSRLPETIRTLPEALDYWADQTPTAPALIVPGEPVISYADLRRNVFALAESLNRAGFGREDRVALLVPEGPHLALSLLGTMSAAVAVPLASTLTASELTAALDGLDAAGAVVTPSLPAQARACLNCLGVVTFDLDPAQPLFDEAGTGQDSSAQLSFPPQPGDIAVVSQTSGTTGRPKRVPRVHERLIESGRRHRDRFGLEGSDRALAVAPMTVSMGRTALLHGIAAGSSLIFPASPDLGDIWAAIESERPTWMHASAGFLELLARWLRGHPTLPAPNSLRFVRVTAAPIASDMCDELAARLGAPILPAYSTSETGIIATALPPPAQYKPGSTGRLMQDIRIVEGDADVAHGAEGEIWVRGPSVLSGYLDDPELTATAFTADGWLRTGDVGYLDVDGFLFLTGRLKELINRGGAKISPAEVDAVLLAHPAVMAAATFAAPDERLGEDIVAAVIAAEGCAATLRELRTWMLDRLAPHKVPHRIWFVADLPRTPTGKVQRCELSRLWRAESA